MRSLAALATLSTVALVSAQDPAQGWLGYAKGVSPTGNGRITYMEAYWTVGGVPEEGGAFYSPWFGIEAADNLNLLQPVNPWVGDSWDMYNEYFQWSPTYNYNSDDHTVQPGDVLFGSITFNPNNQTYTIYHADMNDGWSVSTNIAVQKDRNGNYKNYTIAYVVYEKPAQCAQYPPDGQVTFYNIRIDYDGKTVTPKWTTSYVDDVCNNRAHIVNSTTVQITWNVNGENPPAELVELHQNVDRSFSFQRRQENKELQSQYRGGLPNVESW